MPLRMLIRLFTLAQLVLAVRVVSRMVKSSGGAVICPVVKREADAGPITVIVPTLNEAARLGLCLDGLSAQTDEVAEILVVDGGSTDGTQALVRGHAERDGRIRLIDAGPAPPDVNGKAHNLQAGLDRARADAVWILTIDADVRPDRKLARSLLAHAAKEDVRVFSAATRQRLADRADGLIHPALLTTLVYRFGIPGRATTAVAGVQANGQCFMVRRDLLLEIGGFAGVQDSICEDVTLARAFAARGERVGFYEAGDLVDVEMYPSWRETWTGWTRSLPMRDRFSGLSSTLGLAEVLLVQAAPLWITVVALLARVRRRPATILNGALLATRLGVLGGTRRAYVDPPASYWLSPLCDLPAAVRLLLMARRRRHIWRGRSLVRGETR